LEKQKGVFIMTNDCVIKILKEKGLMVAVAESLTGGALTAALVAVAGASAVVDEGVVAYSNGSKVARLGVKQDSIDMFGAVSAQVAMEMAFGIIITSEAHVGIATTGIAGPGGGTDEKPVGTVFIGTYFEGEAAAFQFNFKGNREEVINQSVAECLKILWEGVYEQEN
jgi:PncC family amidohydrolase